MNRTQAGCLRVAASIAVLLLIPLRAAGEQAPGAAEAAATRVELTAMRKRAEGLWKQAAGADLGAGLLWLRAQGAEVLRDAGRALENGRWAEAKGGYEEVVQRAAEIESLAARRAARIAQQRGIGERMLKAAREAAATKSYLAAKKAKAAVPAWTELANVHDANDYSTWMAYAESCELADLSDDAMAAYRKAAFLSPGRPKPQWRQVCILWDSANRRSAAHGAEGRMEAARRRRLAFSTAENLLQQFPAFRDVHVWLLRRKIELREGRAALAQAEMSVKRFPRDAELLELACRAATAERLWKRAVDYGERLAGLEPKRVDRWLSFMDLCLSAAVRSHGEEFARCAARLRSAATVAGKSADEFDRATIKHLLDRLAALEKQRAAAQERARPQTRPIPDVIPLLEELE